MGKQENVLVKNAETQENDKMPERVKKILKKQKKIVIVGCGMFAIFGTNSVTAKIAGNKAFRKGVSKGINMVMSNPSMLGKGLNAAKKLKNK